MKSSVETCVIGSYPIALPVDTFMNQYYQQQPISWQPIIADAVNDMVRAGLDIIADGQTRDPMVQLFTRKLHGCRVRERTEIIDKISYQDPITVDDQQYVRSLIPTEKKLIGVLTGPYTLTKSCINSYYSDEQEISFDFAAALQQEAEAVASTVDILGIDEPFFSNEFPEYGHDLIHQITQNISIPTRLHVCGDVSSIIPQLLDMPVDILSHEFKASPQLFDAFQEYTITKQICLGAVRSDDPTVESVEDICTHIEQAIQVFDGQIAQLSPDCGQRFLPRENAFQKLHNLVQAGEQIYGR